MNKATITQVGKVVDGVAIGWGFVGGDYPAYGGGTGVICGYTIDELRKISGELRVSLEQYIQIKKLAGGCTGGIRPDGSIVFDEVQYQAGLIEMFDKETVDRLQNSLTGLTLIVD